MVPEKTKSLSLKRNWHLLVILLCSTLAIASETSNFLFGNEAFLFVIEQQETAGNIPFSFHLVRPELYSNFCASDSLVGCWKINGIVRFIIFLILIFCAVRYWKLDIKNQELLELYRQMFDVKATSPSPEQEIARILQYTAYKKLKFRGTDRVSVYKYSRNLDCFFRVGRFSTDPKFDGKGRLQYKTNQGVIGAAWSADADYKCVSNIPKFADNDVKGMKEYLDSKGIGGFTQAELRGMRMKSRSIYAFRTVEPDSGIKAAVIVFESCEPDRFTTKQITAILQSDYGNILKSLINRRSVSTTPVLEPENDNQ